MSRETGDHRVSDVPEPPLWPLFALQVAAGYPWQTPGPVLCHLRRLPTFLGAAVNDRVHPNPGHQTRGNLFCAPVVFGAIFVGPAAHGDGQRVGSNLRFDSQASKGLSASALSDF